jgi:crotonobetainyl-CoA:carnitine CoA-transferase CaiB-like acyl-CoA transferase
MTALPPTTSTDTPRTPGAGPLEGIIVADFARVLAGPYCTMLLADLGATVIKVESAGGDDTRSWRPPTYRDQASYYQAVNRNKHSIVLDLTDEDDRATAHAIAARADVFVHNFKPGSIERLGFGYDDVRAYNESIIYAHISGFGTKEGASLPGYDVLVQGMAGLMDMNGEPDGMPVRSGISLFDLSTGMRTALGITAAVRHRDLTGEGQLIENNLMANAVFTMANQYQPAVTHGQVLTRNGAEHSTLYPYNAFPTGDGELIIVAVNDGQFKRLAAELGHPEWVEDPRFLTPELRNLNRDDLRALIEGVLAAKGKHEWFEQLKAAGLPCAPVQNVGEGLATATELGLDPAWHTDDPDSVATIRNPLSMSASPPSYRKEPPALGEDGDAIRAWLASE